MKKAVEVFTEFLAGQNLKMTHQRALILDVFLATEKHLTSADLYALVRHQDKSIGQATVYRTVKLLFESGVAEKVDFGHNTFMYEHKYGHAHHDHLFCEKCKKEFEVTDSRIERLQVEMARKCGFLLTGHKMVLFGVCRECREGK